MIDYEADLVENKLKRKSMTSKVLVADDSLTIQKVINITLANSGYELVECLNEQDLLNKVESNSFDKTLSPLNTTLFSIGFLKASSASRISIKLYSSLFNCFNCSTEIFMNPF